MKDTVKKRWKEIFLFLLVGSFAKLAILLRFEKEIEDIERTNVEKKDLASNETFNPFSLWSRKDLVSKETFSAVLRSVGKDSLCYKNSLSTPMNALEQVALAIRKKFPEQVSVPGRKLVFAVIGDSVSADKEGWVAALQSFLTVSLSIPFPVEVRNYAHGGRGPHYFSTCNDLHGDEDVVLFENVRPYEADAVFKLTYSLISSGYGAILFNWRSIIAWSKESHLFGFDNASKTFGVPLLTYPVGRERIKECLPANANNSLPEEVQIYRDQTHPNHLGEVIIATMVGQLFEDAVTLYNDTNVNWNEVEKKRLSAINDNFSSNYHDSLCMDLLNCTAPPASGEEFAKHRCLNVQRSDGFEKKSLPSGKVWWQGTQPGHSIELTMPGTCVQILIFHNLRVTNGMVGVEVDGHIPKRPLTNGTLDGWFKGFHWLPKHRAHNLEASIATDLPKAEEHIVRLTILNKTNSEDGTHKFDFTGMGCTLATL